MGRANGSRLDGPRVPPSPSLRIHTGFHTRTTRATAALLGPCFKTGRMQPTAGQATTAQGVRRPPDRTDPRSRTLHAVTRLAGRTEESAPAAHEARTCATGVDVPPLSSVGLGRSARPAVSSPPSPERRLRYLPDAHSSPGARRTWPAPAAESAGVRTSLRARTTHWGAHRTRDPPQPRELDAGRFGCMRFPPNGFAASLTLFPKCFSPFPHGTCSLSVSCRYLALDGVYHPLWAAIPNNPTLRRR